MSGSPIDAYPPGPTVSLQRMEEARQGTIGPSHIAANIMPLAGVENPTKGDGQTRSLKFSELTVNAILHGVPGKVKKEALVPTAHSIFPAAISRFGPNTLAAAVLTGANYLFNPIVANNRRILDHAPFRTLSPNIRLGIAACLSFQMFREQPNLFVLGGQAWRMQQTLLNNNLGAPPLVPQKHPYPARPSSFAPSKPLEELGGTFFDLCLETAQEAGALIDVGKGERHVVPKVIAHPGEFTERFLKQSGRFPEAGEGFSMPSPLSIDLFDQSSLMAFWAGNDLTARANPESQSIGSFRALNEELAGRMRAGAAGPRPQGE